MSTLLPMLQPDKLSPSKGVTVLDDAGKILNEGERYTEELQEGTMNSSTVGRLSTGFKKMNLSDYR
jgi:hypothetical protein